MGHCYGLRYIPVSANLQQESENQGLTVSYTYDDIPFRGIVEQSLAGVYVIQDEVFQYVNATFAGMVGYRQDEMIGMHLLDSVIPSAQAQLMRNYRARISGETPSIRFITQGRHKTGRAVHLEVHGTRLIYRGRPAVVGVGIDISENVLREEELCASRENLQELATYINTVREEQRAMIARELHDVIGGMLTTLKMEISRIARRSDTPALQEMTHEALELARETIDTVRRLSEDLRPGVLDHLGLAAAIRSGLDKFSRASGLTCRLTPEQVEIPICQERATGAYRIFQEALTNIARHAQARSVSVSFISLDGAVEMWIEDDGVGLPPPGGQRRGLGLVNMSERARELGGCLDLESPAAGGTRVRLWIPLAETVAKPDVGDL